MLNGNWRLVYTSSPSVLALIGLSNLPLVKIGDITQTIDGPGMMVENKVSKTVDNTSSCCRISFDFPSSDFWNSCCLILLAHFPSIVYRSKSQCHSAELLSAHLLALMSAAQNGFAYSLTQATSQLQSS